MRFGTTTTFLEPEYPFEWTGVYSLEPGRYEFSLQKVQIRMSLWLLPIKQTILLFVKVLSGVRRYAEPADVAKPGSVLPLAPMWNCSSKQKVASHFTFIALQNEYRHAQHTAKTDMLFNADGEEVSPKKGPKANRNPTPETETFTKKGAIVETEWNGFGLHNTNTMMRLAPSLLKRLRCRPAKPNTWIFCKHAV